MAGVVLGGAALAAAAAPPPATTAALHPAADVEKQPKVKIAIVGGTYLNDAIFDRGVIRSNFTVETKIGTSPTIHYAEYNGIPFYYVNGHGEGKWLETWAALYDLGVKEAIGGATAGGINPAMKTYDYVVPDDFIDMNVDRPLYMPRQVFHNPNDIPLPRFVPAMDPLLRDILVDETRRALRTQSDLRAVTVHDGGVVMQARGGRFETAAEIRMMAQWGADLVTMNVATEIAYARMLGINYACLVVISNPAEGVAEWAFSDLAELYPRINPLSLDIVLAALPRIVALEGQERVGDSLRLHPEMTSRKKD